MRLTTGTAALTMLLFIPAIVLIIYNTNRAANQPDTGAFALIIAGIASPLLATVLGAIYTQKKRLRKIGVWLILLGIVFLLAVISTIPSR
jgi:hypothetical protein